MNKQTANIVSIAALVLAAIALVLQFVFAGSGHYTRALAAEIAWPILLLICIGVFVWGRRMKS
jgi:hypothetical protein